MSSHLEVHRNFVMNSETVRCEQRAAMRYLGAVRTAHACRLVSGSFSEPEEIDKRDEGTEIQDGRSDLLHPDPEGVQGRRL